MAKIANPRKGFQFNVIIPGVNPFTCQEVTLPDNEIDQVEHGDTNYDVKTGGKIKLSNMRINRIVSALDISEPIWRWMEQIQSAVTGGGQLPSLYKLPIVVEQLAPNGITVLQRWTYEGCWPCKINGIEFSRVKSENTIENIEFSVDRLLP